MLKRKGSNFHSFLFSKLRKVKISHGGAKIVVYEYRFCGILFFKKSIDFSKNLVLDGGGVFGLFFKRGLF
ncbi:hypothetical protein FMM56_00710 [Campylobacter sp. LR264d]|uniref:hypothetical protein n=1 Tax=Campylobacter sp. LR264d TaxID=2593544 RepID=UPI00123A9825|nr:hypothetical protein [Campylobacter sp. LR264d]KAA6234395.1 hypothetical protein FMM56_00710 [Campylobacter sp. LR264d]